MPFAEFSVPPQWRCTISDEGFVEFQEPETILIRSQDLPSMYYDPGQFYIYKTKGFVESKGKVSNKIAGIKISGMEVQDIDNIEDWKMAEIKYKLMLGE